MKKWLLLTVPLLWIAAPIRAEILTVMPTAADQAQELRK